MSYLLSLELHVNGLSGSLPSELYNANNLQLLNVAEQYQNSYQCTRSDGTVVNTLYAEGDSTNGYNYGLQGPVLGVQVSSWQSMKGLHLFDNSFSGTIADEIGDLRYLGEWLLERDTGSCP